MAGRLLFPRQGPITGIRFDNPAKDLLQQIAANAPLSVRLAKRSIAVALADGPAGAERELAEGRRRCLLSDDHAEGRRAFAEKRMPVFKGS